MFQPSRVLSPSVAEVTLEYHLVCGIPLVARAVNTICHMHGFVAVPTARTTVLLDIPYGFAFHALQRLGQTQHPVVIITWNTCVEYLEDVWHLQPMILLANVNLEQELPHALVRAIRGEQYRRTPPGTTQLSPPERAILRSLALGWSNQQIADALGVREKTVRNLSTSVYAKLGVENRTQATLYYWGRSDLLDCTGNVQSFFEDSRAFVP